MEDLVTEVEEDLREVMAEAAAEGGPGVNDGDFVTAVFIDLPSDDDRRILVANLGHPPPLLLHAGMVSALEPTTPTPPLGLGDLAGARPPADTFGFPPGSTLLLYTDGVVEARNRDGDFYPLADRLGRWTALPPAGLLDAIHSDLRHHVGARLGDDVAMVAIRRIGAVRTGLHRLSDPPGSAAPPAPGRRRLRASEPRSRVSLPSAPPQPVAAP